MILDNKILDNNIVVLRQGVSGSRAVSIGFWFAVGSRMENSDCRGISHFTEHMLFKGTRSRTARDISVAFDRIGGYSNAFTESEDVCAYCTVPALGKNLETALDVLCDMSCNCVFDPYEFEKERQVIKNEILMVKDDMEESSAEKLASIVWPTSTLGMPITGTLRDLQKITVKNLASWYKKYFAKGQLIVTVTGPEKFVKNPVVEQRLSLLPLHKPYTKFHFDRDAVFCSRRKFLKSNFFQAQLYLAFPFKCSLTKGEFFASMVFNTILGDAMSSRLFETLREKNGICYSVYSYFSYYEDASMWCSVVSCSPKNVAKAKSLLEREVFSFMENPPDDSEISNAIEHLCGEETISSCDTEYAMKNLSRNFSMGLPLLKSSEVIDCIRSVKKNDIMDIAKSVIIRENSTFLVFSSGSRIDVK